MPPRREGRLAALSALALALAHGGAAPPCARSAQRDVSGAPYALVAAPGSPFALCPVHDPAVARDDSAAGGGALYLLSTDAGGLPAPPFLNLRVSRDNGTTWAAAGAIFDAIPAWALAAVPRATNIWAPDVSLSASGEWRVYYAVSSFGSETSVIGLAATPSLAQPAWADRGLVLRSDSGDGFNAIDPNLFAGVDAAGAPESWLLHGSFWDGIFMARVDAASGLLATGAAAARVHLAQRAAPDALEGAFMVQRGAFHYLFASFDLCCRGVASNYSVHVGRSATGAQGPFVDRAGVPMLQGGGTRVAGGGFGWAASGGQSVLRESVSEGVGSFRMVLHAYDGESGAPFLNFVEVRWTSDGWPEALSEEGEEEGVEGEEGGTA